MELQTLNEFNTFLNDIEKPLKFFHFYIEEIDQCKYINDIINELTHQYPTIFFCKINVKNFPELVKSENVSSVPTIYLYYQKERVDTIIGPNIEEINQKIVKLTQISSNQTNINTELEKLVKSNPLMIFIKGTPTTPRCKFSRALIELFDSYSLTYGFFDILENEIIRQQLKEYSNWPTYPQIFYNGEFLGGLDIITEMIQTNELFDKYPSIVSKNSDQILTEYLKKLTTSNDLVLFIKGTIDNPKCGFSHKIVQCLLKNGFTNFDTFDILTDDRVRQGLKEYSDWPTFPQLYWKGTLIGGLDIIEEMISTGEFQNLVGSNK